MTESSNQKYHIHVSSKHHFLELKLKEVWQYRDLIALFVRRDFTVSFKQTILGPAWIFLTPLFSSLVHAFVFGGIAGISTEGIPTLLFYLCSNAVWTFFANCLVGNAGTFTNNAHVFGKVYFPRLTTPVANVFSSAIRFGIQMLLVLGFLAYFLILGQVSPNWLLWMMIPVELVHLGILGMGCGIIISSMTTKYRDLSVLVDFGVSAWMYITPVVYPLSTLADGWIRNFLLINPVTPCIELMRLAILGQGTVYWGFYALSWVVTILLAVLGIMMFNKVERTFMDTV